MKNKTLRGLVFISLSTLLTSCYQKKEETVAVAVDKDQIKKEIQAMEDAFAKAYNERNLDAIVYYDTDAITYSQNAPALVGKIAIDKSISKDIESFPKGYKISNTTNEVHISNDGEQVVEIGAYHIVDSTNTLKSSGNYISLFKKLGSKYICIRDMAASNMPRVEKK